MIMIDRPNFKTVDPVTSTEWANLVSSTPSTLFHTPKWMELIQKTYGLSFSASVLERDAAPVAGVCWSEIEDFLGCRRVTLPFSDFCDVLAATPEDARLLADQVMQPGLPWTLRTLARNLPEIETPPTQSTSFMSQAIDLSPDITAIQERLTSAARRGVRKAERSGMEICQATSKQQLRDWFLLHLKLRKGKYNLLAQPYSFFENIWDIFFENGQGFLLLAIHQGQVIAGILFLVYKDVCYYKFNASDEEHLSLRPNNLLMWKGILKAKAEGYRSLDLGRSSVRQQGLVAYKRSFGATEEDMLSLTFGPNGSETKGNQEGRQLLESLTGILVQDSVPESVAEEASALLYRYFV